MAVEAGQVRQIMSGLYRAKIANQLRDPVVSRARQKDVLRAWLRVHIYTVPLSETKTCLNEPKNYKNPIERIQLQIPQPNSVQLRAFRVRDCCKSRRLRNLIYYLRYPHSHIRGFE